LNEKSNPLNKEGISTLTDKDLKVSEVVSITVLKVNTSLSVWKLIG